MLSTSFRSVAFLLLFLSVENRSNFASAQSTDATDFQLRMPYDTVCFIRVEDSREFLTILAKTKVGEIFEQILLGKVIAEAIRDSTQLTADQSLSGEGLLTELAEVFEGPSQFVLFPSLEKHPSSTGLPLSYRLEFKLNEEHFYVQALEAALEADRFPWKKISSDQLDAVVSPVWRINEGCFLRLRNSQITLASSEHVLNELRFEGTSKEFKTIAENRKWLRVQSILDCGSASAFGYIDTTWLIEEWIRNSPDPKAMRLILGDTGILEALATGWSLQLKPRGRDWQLDAFLLCSVPRKGVWQALSMKPLPNMELRDCPIDAGYMLQGNLDLKQFVDALTKLERLAQDQYGYDKQEFLKLISDYMPPLVMPIVFRDHLQELFDGRFFVFGNSQQTGESYNQNSQVGLNLRAGKDQQTVQLLLGLFPPDDPPVRRSRGDSHWYLQGEESWRAIRDRLNQLAAETNQEGDQKQIPRVAFVCQEDRLIRFGSEFEVERSLTARENPEQSIISNQSYMAVIRQVSKVNSNGHPCMVIFLEEKEAWSKLKFDWYGPGAKINNQVWQQQIDDVEMSKQDWRSPLKRSWLKNQPDQKSIDRMGNRNDIIGGGVWDVDSGFHLSLFGISGDQENE